MIKLICKYYINWLDYYIFVFVWFNQKSSLSNIIKQVCVIDIDFDFGLFQVCWYGFYDFNELEIKIIVLIFLLGKIFLM